MNRVSLILFICLLSTLITRAQHPVIIGSSKYAIDYSKHPGYIILRDGKKLQGIFEYAEMEFPGYNFKFYASEKGPLISRIKFTQINSITLAGADTTVINSDSTYFFNLQNNNRLYRKLTTGDIEIFDNFFNVSQESGLVRDEDLIVMRKGKMTSVHSRKELIQLLESYGVVLQPGDRMTVRAIIKMINANPG
ncbi:MAG: hypothetical protein JST75_18370 [Bacteroidetes bacterium]|nr:hypothetical protein [Bacteroidota bacterium]